MRFHLTDAAIEDLLQIYVNGVEQFGIDAAEKYQDKIDHSLTLIGERPEIAPMRSDITPPVRVHPVGVHIIVYHINDQGQVPHQRPRAGHHIEGTRGAGELGK